MFESKELIRKVEFLEDERKNLWERLTRLEREAKENATTHEKNAQQSSKKAAEFKNKAEERREQIEEIYTQANATIVELKAILGEVKTINETATQEKEVLESSIDTVNKNAEILENRIVLIDTFLKKYPYLESNISSLDSNLATSQENFSKISAIFKNITEKKNEIDELYYEIAGYVEKDDETGDEKQVDGLKGMLEMQFQELSKSIKDSETTLNSHISENTKKVDDSITSWDNRYSTIINKIESLLPNALTTGLSYAYSDKKTKEIEHYESLKKQFNIGITGLILTSLLTLSISVYFIKTGTSFKDVINILPNISAALIPLYIPMLWYTFAAIKRVNLSKRLIEEYTHKEVISKTFEGLSAQISNLEGNPVSKELRLKLLFNLLEMSTENPGKLISEYKNSDHPVLEVLKHQSKLEQALKMAKEIPGVSRLKEIVFDTKVKEIQEKKLIVEKIAKDLEELIR